MKQWLPDGHDSQEVPEENTGTYWLDIGVRIAYCEISQYASLKNFTITPLAVTVEGFDVAPRV